MAFPSPTLRPCVNVRVVQTAGGSAARDSMRSQSMQLLGSSGTTCFSCGELWDVQLGHILGLPSETLHGSRTPRAEKIRNHFKSPVYQLPALNTTSPGTVSLPYYVGKCTAKCYQLFGIFFSPSVDKNMSREFLKYFPLWSNILLIQGYVQNESCRLCVYKSGFDFICIRSTK